MNTNTFASKEYTATANKDIVSDWDTDSETEMDLSEYRNKVVQADGIYETKKTSPWKQIEAPKSTMSINGFPSLSEAKNVKTPQKITIIPEPDTRRLPTAPRNQYAPNVRTSAFEQLKSIDKHNVQEKSKFCRHVLNKRPCVVGDKCKFAHTLQELNPVKCVIKSNCRFQDTERCQFIHPGEHIKQMAERIGLIPKENVRPKIRVETISAHPLDILDTLPDLFDQGVTRIILNVQY